MDTHIHGRESMHSLSAGAHMPLDTAIHWDWRNPLNILPALLLLALAFALAGCLLPLV